MANASDLVGRQFESYSDTGTEGSIEITLGSANVVTTLTLPDTAKGVKIWPKTNPIQFAVNRAVATLPTSSSTTIAASALGIGGIAKNDQWEQRLLPSGTGRTLSMSSGTSSTVVDIEVF